MDMFPTFGFTASLGTALTFIFYLLAALYVLFSVVLYYHWAEYAVDNRVRNLSLIIYFILTLPLIATMGLTAFIS